MYASFIVFSPLSFLFLNLSSYFYKGIVVKLDILKKIIQSVFDSDGERQV